MTKVIIAYIVGCRRVQQLGGPVTVGPTKLSFGHTVGVEVEQKKISAVRPCGHNMAKNGCGKLFLPKS